MTFLKASGALSLLTLSALSGSLANAAESGWYASGNLGQARASIDDARISNALQLQGYSSSSITDRNRDTGYKLQFGYQLNRHFAIESGYFDLGKFGYTATTIPTGMLSGDVRFKGLNLDLIGMLPLTDKFSALARIGVTSARTSGTFASNGPGYITNANPSVRDTNLKVGLGVMYNLTDALALRLEAERYRVNDAVGNRGHVDMVSLGVLYRFGTPTEQRVAQRSDPVAAPPVAEPSVAAVVPVAMPTPVPLLVPPPPPPALPVPVRVTFAADALFDFDKSAMKPGGRAALDKFAMELKGSTYDSIQVTGHTDRIGAAVYNGKLSARRAAAVSAYLVDTAGIPAYKIRSEGVGEANPITKAGDCIGTKTTPALIACLQPDRRVDVEMSGTK